MLRCAEPASGDLLERQLELDGAPRSALKLSTKGARGSSSRCCNPCSPHNWLSMGSGRPCARRTQAIALALENRRLVVVSDYNQMLDAAATSPVERLYRRSLAIGVDTLSGWCLEAFVVDGPKSEGDCWPARPVRFGEARPAMIRLGKRISAGFSKRTRCVDDDSSIRLLS